MDEQKEFDSARFDALMKLADFRYQRWRVRRETDWKLSLALWTLLVAGAAYGKVKGKIPFSDHWFITALVLVVLVILHAFFWVRNNFIASEMDIKTGFHFAKQSRT